MERPSAMTSVRVVKMRPNGSVELPETLATEEPMEIRVAGPGQEPAPLAVTMRTPGHDFELAAGFVVTEGIARPDDIAKVAYCVNLPGPQVDPESRFNTVTVTLARAWEPPAAPRRFDVNAACGVCGKTSIDDVAVACEPVGAAPPLAPSLISTLPGRLRAAQPTFDRTGGLHAAGLFTPDGDLVFAREDVGRHNAVDKVVGATVLDPADLDLAGAVLMVSGRVSFEIVQKAAVAGIGTIAAVSAPSSLAVQAASSLGVAVAAFVRGDTFNVYSHPERIVGAASVRG